MRNSTAINIFQKFFDHVSLCRAFFVTYWFNSIFILKLETSAHKRWFLHCFHHSILINISNWKFLIGNVSCYVRTNLYHADVRLDDLAGEEKWNLREEYGYDVRTTLCYCLAHVSSHEEWTRAEYSWRDKEAC